MHYDVKFGGTVVMTVTDPDDANSLAAELQRVSLSSGFQTEDINSDVVETDRGSEMEETGAEEGGYYDFNSDEALEYIRSHEDPEDVRRIILLERSHSRYDGGRTGVIDKAEEYLGELIA